MSPRVLGSLSLLLGAALIFTSPEPATTARISARSPCDAAFAAWDTVAWECRVIRPGETLERLFGDRWPDVASFNRIDRRHAMPGARIRVPRRLESLTGWTPLPARHAPAVNDSQYILVDLDEQFLGAYVCGELTFSMPIASGAGGSTPEGLFRVTAWDREHFSSLYDIEETETPYPMTWALRFHVDPSGTSYWIHGRDLPGYPASHGCIGLTDEAMQKKYYGAPRSPVLADARRLFEWVARGRAGAGLEQVDDGPTVEIVRPRTRAESAPMAVAEPLVQKGGTP